MIGVMFQCSVVSHELLTADDITDIIEAIVDTLDDAGLESSVGTVGTGERFDLTIEIVGSQPSELGTHLQNELEAFTRVLMQIGAALDEAKISRHGRAYATDIRTATHSLQSA